MSVILDTARAAIGTPPRPARLPDKIPPDIDGRLRRGRVAKERHHNLRLLCQRFWEGNQYWFQTARGNLSFQTAGIAGVVGVDKAGYRIRNTYNYVGAVVEAKVSAATGSVPGYEVTPSTDDPEDEAAASLAGQVATYGYEHWRMRRHTTKAVTNALVQREGFVKAYFDPNVGPYTQDPGTGKWEGAGEIRLLNLCRDEVMWEPGQDFDDSRWHAIEQERLKDEIRQLPGYVPGSIDIEDKTPAGKSGDKMTLTEYLERPSPDYPQGRRCFIAQGRIVVDYRTDPACEDVPGWTDWFEPFPCMDATGEVCDEPAIHRVSYTVNAHGDDMGLVERLIDLQRTVNDTWNKILELKNRALLLQTISPKGSNMPRRDDTPGANYEYNAVGDRAPEWEKPPDPALLAQLVQIHELAVSELRSLAADIDVQPDPRLSPDAANIAVTQGAARWQSFLGDLAEFHSRLMRHCLSLVARYYSEGRQIEIRGQYGWQPLASFDGQDLRSQVNVRVLPGSLGSKSRQAMREEVSWIQQNWPGAIEPEAALAYIHGGSSEGLVKSYQNDVAKAWRVVRRLKTGPDAFATFPTRFDPSQPNPNFNPALPPGEGNLQYGADVPGWMPSPADNIKIWRTLIGDYTKTEDFEHQDPAIQHAFWLVWDGLAHAEQQRAAQQAAQQQMQAQSLGMSNAAKPQLPPPLPDRAGLTQENSSSPAPAPETPS